MLEIKCPLPGCDKKATKSAIRMHLHKDHGMSSFEAERTIPYNTGRATKPALFDRIRFLEEQLSKANLAQPENTEGSMDNEDALSKEITGLKVSNQELTGRIAVLEEDKKGLQAQISELTKVKSAHDVLQATVAELSSPDHDKEVVTRFLKDLDQDSFIALGIKKGFLEEVAADASDEDVAAVEEPAEAAEAPAELGEGRKVFFSKEKPADPTGWEYSKVLATWVSIK